MSIGIWQLLLIVLIVFVIFGAGKLPRVMGDIGKGVRSMRDGLKAEEEDLTEESKKIAHEKTPAAFVETQKEKDRKES